MTEMEFAWIIFGAQILLPAIMAMCAALFCHPEPEGAWFFWMAAVYGAGVGMLAYDEVVGDQGAWLTLQFAYSWPMIIMAVVPCLIAAVFPLLAVEASNPDFFKERWKPVVLYVAIFAALVLLLGWLMGIIFVGIVACFVVLTIINDLLPDKRYFTS